MTPPNITSQKMVQPTAAVEAAINALETRQAEIDAQVREAVAAAAAIEERAPITRRHFNRQLRGYRVTDALALAFGFVMALGLAALINGSMDERTALSPLTRLDSTRVAVWLIVAASVMLWFQHKGYYRVRMNFWAEAKAVIGAFSVAMILDGFLQFAAKHDFSRIWLMAGWVFAGLAVLTLRGLYRRKLRARGQWEVATLLVGSGVTAEDTRAALESEPGLGYRIVAQIERLPEAYLAAGRSWERLCQQNRAEYVVIALDGAELDQATHPIAQLTREDVPFSISPPRRHLPIVDMAPQYFLNHDIKLLTYSSGLEQPLPRFIKRAFDVAVAGTLLLLASPVMLLIALMVKRDGGPVFFGHARIGKNGSIFQCLKFRSMIHHAQAVLEKYLEQNPEARAEWEADHKLKNDPRITKFGAFLRRSSLDELPQLINVLKGEMSLVGPRPIVNGEVPKYSSDIAHYYRVSPGITGLWQVSGRNDVTYEQRVAMDSWYVRNWTLWHDIVILCKTVPALLKRSGAY